MSISESHCVLALCTGVTCLYLSVNFTPYTSYMYWSDWGEESKIEKAGMDGSDRHILINRNVKWPNGLAVDYQGRKLYWVDAGIEAIQSSDLQGNNRKVSN